MSSNLLDAIGVGMAFKDWLRRELQERGWDQAELVRRTGASSSLVSYWLSGARVPQRHSCEDIAAALGLPVQIVLEAAGREVKNPELPPGVDLHDPLFDFFAQNMEKFTPEDREELMRFGLERIRKRGE